MKKSELRNIIKEEIRKILNEKREYSKDTHFKSLVDEAWSFMSKQEKKEFKNNVEVFAKSVNDLKDIELKELIDDYARIHSGHMDNY